VRVSTAFDRMLGLPGAWVRDVEFGEQAMIVTVVLKAKKPVCSGCGARGLRIKEHRVKRWRHLDVGGMRCVIECRLRRLYCPGCGDLPEHVEWARGGARYTRDFDDLTVRHEALLNRVGCRSPPPGCRSSSVKRGAA
jgi:transposase